jgi:hypothetical protein
MISKILQKQEQFIDLIKSLFFENYFSIFRNAVEANIDNAIRHGMRYMENRYGNEVDEDIDFLRKNLSLYLNGPIETRIMFLDAFQSTYYAKMPDTAFDIIRVRVSDYYKKICISDFRRAVLNNQEIVSGVVEFGNKILAENKNGNERIYSDRVEIDEILKKDITDLSITIYNEKRNYLSEIFDNLTRKYNNTIDYFFLTSHSDPIANRATNEVAWRSIEEAEKKLSNNRNFSINKEGLIKWLMESRPANSIEIDYTPEQYEKESSERDYISNECIRRSIEKYNQIEEFKRTYKINDNDRGYSYERIFGEYLKGTDSIIIEEPYMGENYLFDNFMRFCSMVRKFCELKKITLITREFHNKEIEKRIKEFQDDLKSYNIELEINFSYTMHDRRVILNNGWTFILGRGLHIYKAPKGRNTLEAIDFSLRPCRETVISWP